MGDPTRSRRYLEDVAVGRERTYGAYEVTEAEILAFANRYDPQAFHTDPEAAVESRFGGLIASGWHTACIAMRLAVEQGYLTDLAVVAGVGIEGLRWTAPVRPGDVLSVREAMLRKRPSESDPTTGLLDIEIEVTNQDGTTVLSMVWIDLVERSPEAST
jgi:acyl dehydratase